MAFVGPYIVCPFNESHRIIKARLQTHLVKCRKNYPKNHKVVCPFDATHMLDPLEYEHHLYECRTSGNIKYTTVSIGEDQDVGIVPIESACNMETNTLDEEDWTGNNPTYNPVAATENKLVIRSAVGLSKAKKKQFRQRERERLNALANNNSENNVPTETKQPEIETTLRHPKKAAKAALSCASSSTANNISIGDLISKLKEVSVNQSYDTVLSENTNRDEENTSMVQKNPETSFKKTQNTSDTENNDSMIQNAVVQNSNDDKKPDARKVLRAVPRAANLCGQVKKISTGRGVTLLSYQYLKDEISKKGAKNTTIEDYKTIYGYDENGEDPQNKTS